MNQFFSFFGAKWTMAKRLGPPQRPHVVEPFAGSAGYSTYWEPPNVTLVEKDPVIFGVWSYLIRTPAEEILRLPVLIDHVDDAKVCPEAKALIGYWFDNGCARPAKKRSNWGLKNQYSKGGVWCADVRLRIASQVGRIRHWKVINSSWEAAPNVEAHWHIDPPYTRAGKSYVCKTVDYASLAVWVRQRKGFVQVCEASGAEWLPFQRLVTLTGLRSHGRRDNYYEVVYQQGELRNVLI